MILIGQYDSSFVRRVGIALRLYGIPFTHSTWSTFGDAEKLRDFNPLMRVPALVLDDGEVLTDSHMMLDYLDSLVSDTETMFPQRQPDRRRHLAVAALATGLGDKIVSLFYELRLHDAPAAPWVQRVTAQITQTLARLEADRAARSTPWWFGDRIGHADVAVACAIRHGGDCLPDVVRLAHHPALAAHCARAEALPVFQEISQVFIPPA